MRAVAQLYNAMGSINESWLEQGGAGSRRHAERSISELQSADRYLTDALVTIGRLYEYLESHWDEEHDARLRASGFKGALFIIREYRVYLETLQRHVGPHIEVLQQSVRQMVAGPRRSTPFELARQASTRGLCRELIRFLLFEDDMSQTQLVNLSRFAPTNRFPG